MPRRIRIQLPKYEARENPAPQSGDATIDTFKAQISTTFAKLNFKKLNLDKVAQMEHDPLIVAAVERIVAEIEEENRITR